MVNFSRLRKLHEWSKEVEPHGDFQGKLWGPIGKTFVDSNNDKYVQMLEDFLPDSFLESFVVENTADLDKLVKLGRTSFDFPLVIHVLAKEELDSKPPVDSSGNGYTPEELMTLKSQYGVNGTLYGVLVLMTIQHRVPFFVAAAIKKHVPSLRSVLVGDFSTHRGFRDGSLLPFLCEKRGHDGKTHRKPANVYALDEKNQVINYKVRVEALSAAVPSDKNSNVTSSQGSQQLSKLHVDMRTLPTESTVAESAVDTPNHVIKHGMDNGSNHVAVPASEATAKSQSSSMQQSLSAQSATSKLECSTGKATPKTSKSQTQSSSASVLGQEEEPNSSFAVVNGESVSVLGRHIPLNLIGHHRSLYTLARAWALDEPFQQSQPENPLDIPWRAQQPWEPCLAPLIEDEIVSTKEQSDMRPPTDIKNDSPIQSCTGDSADTSQSYVQNDFECRMKRVRQNRRAKLKVFRQRHLQVLRDLQIRGMVPTKLTKSFPKDSCSRDKQRKEYQPTHPSA